MGASLAALDFCSDFHRRAQRFSLRLLEFVSGRFGCFLGRGAAQRIKSVRLLNPGVPDLLWEFVPSWF